MVVVSEVRFEQLVVDALDSIPDGLAQMMDNVVVTIEDGADEPHLLGLYEGVPLTERDDYGGLVMPDKVTIFRQPICAACTDEAHVIEEVRVTVIHEIAHHFGIDDDRLHELGWA